MRIHLLDQLVANQIAAGEVIERPASVVKELLENSLDAGSTKIDISLVGGGIKKIVITDNGRGIVKEDLPLALLRHATSKIVTSDDLHEIITLGFRGEALASIVAVSAFELTSKTKDADCAYKVSVTGFDRQPKIMPAIHQNGTTIEVRDLFCTLPVRRKFLRGEKTEFLYIEDIIKRIVLSHFDCAFTLKHNDKTILQLAIADTDEKMLSRVAKIFGKNFTHECYSVNNVAMGFKLTGWFGKTTFVRRSSDLQYFFVNKRSIKDKVINHAVKSGVNNKLAEGNFPVFILYLELPAQAVDVNVHPTKHEVRFEESRLVHDFITNSIEKLFLLNEYVNSEVDAFSKHVTIFSKEFTPNCHTKQVADVNTQHKFLEVNKFENTAVLPEIEILPQIACNSRHNINLNVNVLQIIAVLGNKFMLVKFNEEDLLFSLSKISPLLVKEIIKSKIISKPLLFAHTIVIKDNINLDGIDEKISCLAQFGFEITITGPKIIVITAVPEFLLWSTLDKIILAILHQVAHLSLLECSYSRMLFILSEVIPQYIIDDFILGYTKDQQKEFILLILNNAFFNTSYIKLTEQALVKLF